MNSSANFEQCSGYAIVAASVCQVAEMLKMETDISLETSIGIITARASVCASDVPEDCLSLKAKRFQPWLPDGMSVRNCIAVLLTVARVSEIRSLQLMLSVATRSLGLPCTGQYLDAQEWSDRGNLVVIGTEDSEALLYRMPDLRSDKIQVVDFTRHSMTMKLKDLRVTPPLTFHFIIAENNHPEPVDDSAWFAVDQNHRYVLDQLRPEPDRPA